MRSLDQHGLVRSALGLTRPYDLTPGIAQATGGLVVSMWHAVREASPATWETRDPHEYRCARARLRKTPRRPRRVLLELSHVLASVFEYAVESRYQSVLRSRVILR